MWTPFYPISAGGEDFFDIIQLVGVGALNLANQKLKQYDREK